MNCKLTLDFYHLQKLQKVKSMPVASKSFSQHENIFWLLKIK